MVEFILKFYPVKTKGMKKSTKGLHHEKYEGSCKGKNSQPHQPNDKVVIPVITEVGNFDDWRIKRLKADQRTDI